MAWAAQPVSSVIIGNTSANPVPVREQNLDANGNVKVHEQGTAEASTGSRSRQPLRARRPRAVAPARRGAFGRVVEWRC